MKVIIVGCGRVGAHHSGRARAPGPRRRRHRQGPDGLPSAARGFRGRTLQGYAFERATLEEAGIAEPTHWWPHLRDNTNAVTARVGEGGVRVPTSSAASTIRARRDYRRYGVQTFAPTAWSSSKIIELITSPDLEREHSFGNGEVQMLAAWVPEHLVGKPVNDLRHPRGDPRPHSSCVWAGPAPVSGHHVREGPTRCTCWSRVGRPTSSSR